MDKFFGHTLRQRDIPARVMIATMKKAQPMMRSGDLKGLATMFGIRHQAISVIGGVCFMALEHVENDHVVLAKAILHDAFTALYGTHTNPFAQFGHSYYSTLDLAFRADRMDEIIAHIKKNHVRSRVKKLAN